jgi:alkylation response protein AidB-like acyl-CoA dehydrogenase
VTTAALPNLRSPFALSDEQEAMVDAAARYARDELAPGAVDWDQRKHFPVDVIRNAGALGMGGVYVAEDVGGSGLVAWTRR